jgi:hypothetical protein
VYTHQFAISKASFRVTATRTGLRDIRVTNGKASCSIESETLYQGNGSLASCGGGRYNSVEGSWDTYAGSLDCQEFTEADLQMRRADPDRRAVEIFPTP